MCYFISGHLGYVTLGGTGDRELGAFFQMVRLVLLGYFIFAKVARYVHTQAVVGYVFLLVSPLVPSTAAPRALHKSELTLVQVHRQVAQRVFPLATVQIEAAEDGQIDNLTLQVVVRHDLVLGNIAAACGT